MEMRLLALIPARGGSKGIPRKNIKPLCGKPLIGWSIDAAKKSVFIDQVFVSTEDEEVAAIASDLGAGVPFMRPKELAADDTPGIAPVMHAIDNLPEFDWVLLLQPTSPLRTAEDIDGIVRFCIENDAPSAETNNNTTPVIASR
jgi:CMP-N,N'-diacetyllegionaminic acid synthase